MNAPTPAAALAQPIASKLPITSIAPSSTHIQELRRARFDKKALQELADSILKVGVLQPPVVRPHPKPTDKLTHELVAGERRVLAARLAGLTVIDVNCSALTDEQVLEVQLIENLQREDLHELEEAEGYDELMKLKKIDAEAVGRMVGKSRSYVYARTKLLALCPEVRKDFYAGTLDASTALLLARIPHHDLQRRAVKDLANGGEYGDVVSFRDKQQFIREHYMLRLKNVPFELADEKLLPAAGSCVKCPKRTGNQSDLFADIKGADMCTDPKCFDAKRDAHWARSREALEKAGKTVIAGKEAKAIFDSPYDRNHVGAGYKKLDEKNWDDPKGRTIAQILGADHEAIVHVQNPHTGDLVPVVKSAAVTAALNEKGVKTLAQRAAQSRGKSRGAKDGNKAEEQLIEEIERRRVLAIFKGAPARVDSRMLKRLLTDLETNWEWPCDAGIGLALGFEAPPADADHKFFTKRAKNVWAKLDQAGEGYLVRVLYAVSAAGDSRAFDDNHFKELAQWCGVDLKKIEQQVHAEAKAKKDGAATKASPPTTPKSKPKAKPKAAPKKKTATKGKGKKK